MPESFEQRLKRRLEENRKAFQGIHAEKLNALMGLSRTEIDAMLPDTTDLEVYDQLITLVKQASIVNLKQAALKSRIEEMGEVAFTIASKIPGLV